MYSSKDWQGLTLRTNYIPKKYRGEPDDPHFIPKSPVISRQVFTLQEEEELAKACRSVLAHVQHSDGSNDDYLKNLARHITTKAPRQQSHHKEKSSRSQRSATLSADSGRKSRTTSDRHNESATPSNRSQRSTEDRTDHSTPLTSAAVTPGDTGKQFFDTVEEPITTANEQTAKHQAESSPPHTIYAFLNEPPPSSKRQLPPPASRSMTSLPTSVQKLGLPAPMSNARDLEDVSLNLLRPEFNKSLPELPQTDQSHTSMTIFDLGRSKTKGKKNTQKPKHEAHTSMAIFELGLNRTKSKKSVERSNEERAQKLAEVRRAFTAPPDTKKSRFRFLSIFQKKKQQDQLT